MKRRKTIIAALALLALASCDKVPVGAVGIKVNNWGGDKGVNDQVLSTGWYWVGFSKSLYTFPTFMQTRKWEGKEEFSFQTVEGLVVGAPISISYSVDAEKVPVLFQTYRKGLDEITDIYIHNIIRDALIVVGSTRTIDDVYGAGKAKILGDVQKIVSDKIGPMGIKVDQISIVGSFSLPDTVVASINAKIQATQQAQQRENEVATSKAQAQKAVAEATGEADSRTIKAKAEAQANTIIAQSLSPELVQYQAIMRWDGKLPEVSGGSVPFINLDMNKK
jgi:regulator of protease activity HflC (stomatin/prohibitin superfamily)